jgi:hypothetical protein
MQAVLVLELTWRQVMQTPDDVAQWIKQIARKMEWFVLPEVPTAVCTWLLTCRNREHSRQVESHPENPGSNVAGTDEADGRILTLSPAGERIHPSLLVLSLPMERVDPI